MKVSVITPLYHGKKYIDRIKDMLEKAANAAPEVSCVEWVLSNDDPNEVIENDIVSKTIKITVLNTDVNRGIQGARVRGLKECIGEYILFLDQDDIIRPEWIKNQCEKIGEADAVVCDAIYNGKPLYNEGSAKPSLEHCITRKYNIGCHIGFTVGQTLIKKESIPELWQRRLMTTNCCDDHYLFLCMFAKGCSFVKNEEVLYEHTKTGANQSEDIFEWVKSTHELMHIIQEENVLDKNEVKAFVRSREKHIEEVVRGYKERNSEATLLRNVLLCRLGKNKIHAECLQGKRIAIYGYRTGQLFSDILQKCGFDVACFIDRDAENITDIIPTYTIECTPIGVDCIIDTLMKDEYKNEIREYYETFYPTIEVINAPSIFS